MGTYVLPMPEGQHVKKALYRQLRRLRVAISNRYMATRLLKSADGRIAGAIGVNTRTGEFLVVRAKAVILACGAAGRLGLPASGYLFGTYENAANSGDGYAMAYHAGAELANLECFQINPLIKDYNGPACAYVAGPFGGYTANNQRHPLHRMRLLVGPDDAGVLARAAIRQRDRFSSSSTICAGETISRDRDHPAHQSSGPRAAASTSGAAPTIASA